MSLGPGSPEHMTPKAREALARADVIVGYKTYLDLIGELTEGKEVLSSGMRKEVDRCRAAMDRAAAGHRVALVSSGDAGIYGMAGLVFDLCRESRYRVLKVQASSAREEENSSEADFALEVIPGAPAFNAAASLLGAPLMHDFAGVSLSDHLTPWELIEKRLHAVAAADFVIALYNPRSKSRPRLLERAREVLLQHRSPQTPVGIVHGAMREDQWTCVATLETLPAEKVDMQSIVLIGNSQTYVWNGFMVTPRGYMDKYGNQSSPEHEDRQKTGGLMEDQELLKQEPRLLVWGFTNDEKSELDAALKEVQAPPAMTIEKSQGHMPLKEILFTDHRGDSELVNDEKVVLFYNIPQKGIAFLMSLFKQKGLPRPIFAMVTEHSIQWTFHKLLEHLIEEKEEMKRREAAQKKGQSC